MFSRFPAYKSTQDHSSGPLRKYNDTFFFSPFFLRLQIDYIWIKCNINFNRKYLAILKSKRYEIDPILTLCTMKSPYSTLFFSKTFQADNYKLKGLIIFNWNYMKIHRPKPNYDKLQLFNHAHNRSIWRLCKQKIEDEKTSWKAWTKEASDRHKKTKHQTRGTVKYIITLRKKTNNFPRRDMRQSSKLFIEL